eukprot:scaffold246473_cov31-Tisochrysis_lutea.AAC.5
MDTRGIDAAFSSSSRASAPVFTPRSGASDAAKAVADRAIPPPSVRQKRRSQLGGRAKRGGKLIGGERACGVCVGSRGSAATRSGVGVRFDGGGGATIPPRRKEGRGGEGRGRRNGEGGEREKGEGEGEGRESHPREGRRGRGRQ